MMMTEGINRAGPHTVRILVVLVTASALVDAGSSTLGEGRVGAEKHGGASTEHRSGDSSSSVPNVLLITLDDFRPELPVFGRKWLDTPALDSIAARGTAFLRAYVQAPQCCPTRNSFLVSALTHSTFGSVRIEHCVHARAQTSDALPLATDGQIRSRCIYSKALLVLVIQCHNPILVVSPCMVIR